MLAAGFPMNNAVSLLLVRSFAGSEGGASKENEPRPVGSRHAIDEERN